MTLPGLWGLLRRVYKYVNILNYLIERGRPEKSGI